MTQTDRCSSRTMTKTSACLCSLWRVMVLRRVSPALLSSKSGDNTSLAQFRPRWRLIISRYPVPVSQRPHRIHPTMARLQRLPGTSSPAVTFINSSLLRAACTAAEHPPTRRVDWRLQPYQLRLQLAEARKQKDEEENGYEARYCSAAFYCTVCRRRADNVRL